jgi:hypothetical protein
MLPTGGDKDVSAPKIISVGIIDELAKTNKKNYFI